MHLPADLAPATPHPMPRSLQWITTGWAALVLGLAPLGCGGGGGGASAPPPAVVQPVSMQVTATPDPLDFNQVFLALVLPPGTDGIRIEFQVDGGAFQSLGDIPAPPTELSLVFDPATPERHTFGFRVTALRATSVLAQAEVSHRRSLKPALNLSTNPKPLTRAMGISWEKDSTSVATGFLLERQEAAGAWTLVGPGTQEIQATPFSAWDLSPLIEGEATYRVVPTYGDERGMPMAIGTRMPLLPPDQLSLSPAPTGRTLSWVNRSALATAQAIYRSSFGPTDLTWTTPVLLGQVGATSTSYLDPASPAEGRVAYQVVALSSTDQTASNWCLGGGPSGLPDLGLTRIPVTVSFYPILRDFDGAWLGPRWPEDLALPSRLERFPAAPGFPLSIPPVTGGRYSSWSFSAALSSAGVLDLQASESAGSSFGAVALHGFRRASGTWTSRTFFRDSGLSLGSSGFLADGSILSFTVDSAWNRGMVRLALDGTATLEADPYPGIQMLGTSRPVGIPTGEGLSLVRMNSGWMLGVRSLTGSWTLQPLPEMDPAVAGQGSLMDLTADETGALHALFSTWVLGGRRYDYLRVRPGNPAEFVSLGLGPEASSTEGRIAVTHDGQKAGFAVIDDHGVLRVGIRSGIGAWSVKSATVPDAAASATPPWLLCGFQPDGRFWVLHTKVSHPFAVRFEGYFDLLEEP